MKYVKGFSVLLVVAALACGGGGTRPDAGSGDTGGQDIVLGDAPGDVSSGSIESAKSTLGREQMPKVPDADMKALAEGNAAFALELYKILAAKEGNVFVAPLSISIALAQVWAGAKGQTADEIASALRFTLPQNALHRAFNALDQTLESRASDVVEAGEPFKLSVVNALWGQKGYPFVQAYLDTLALNYGAGLNLLDFAKDPEAARKLINAWVAEQTYDRIKDLLSENSVDELTRLVITNAIYFKAGWLYKFDATKTHEADFYTLDGTGEKVNMMEMLEPKTLPHVVAENYEAVVLPYVGEKVGMLVILPASGRFAEVEASLDGAAVLALLDALKPEKGRVALPRFGMEYKAALAGALAALGMVTAFSMDADFTGISPTGELYISNVVHQTFLKVDEEGTEAAGATAVVFEGTMEQPQPFYLVVDRPFLFAIVDLPTRSILFLGRLVDPS